MHHFDKMNTCSHLDKINDWKLYMHFLQLAKKAKTKRFVPERCFIINFPFTGSIWPSPYVNSFRLNCSTHNNFFR